MKKQNTVTTLFPHWSCIVGIVGFLIPALASVGAAVRAEDGSPSSDAIKAAVAKSLPLLEKGAKGSMEQRKQCFNCHNQGLPIMALTTARSRGFEIDAENLQTQLKFTADFLGRNRQKYLEGDGQGGQVDTAGYALWTLDNGGWKSDETTGAVAEYFLLYQKDLEHWRPQSRRPPSEQSLFTSSYIALRGLKTFGTPEQKDRIDARVEQVRQWLLKTQPQETEDRVFRLRALQVIGASEEEVRRAFTELLQTQRNDGGWAQLPDMESDAYATGTALVALHQAGEMSTDDPNYRKGLSYLISTQHDDGSWHVTSRSKPIQTYFESGYPHGKDQFISIAAAGWSTTALALALPKTLLESK
jgi:squalene-hopene cyclase-like protein